MQLCNDQNNCITDSVIANPKRTESTQGKNPTQSKYAQKNDFAFTIMQHAHKVRQRGLQTQPNLAKRV